MPWIWADVHVDTSLLLRAGSIINWRILLDPLRSSVVDAIALFANLEDQYCI